MNNNPLLTSADWLDKESPLTDHIQDYAPRPAQQLLANAIADCIADNRMLVAEAGTGTGKTFAYLIPALLSRQKVIVSTGTKNLQDQLFYRDLPQVRKGLNLPVKIALLKGRANYVCLYHLERHFEQGVFPSRQIIKDMRYIRSQVHRTQSGEISEFSQLSENADVWPYATSTTDNCLGQVCPQYQSCYLIKARRKAMDADIVVVNHHLFFSDLQLKEGDGGELLPNATVIVLDEAHQLPEIARQYFGEQFSSRNLLRLLHDIQVEQAVEAKDMPVLSEQAHVLEKATQDLRILLGVAGQRHSWYKIAGRSDISGAIITLTDAFDAMEMPLMMARERSKPLEQAYIRFMEIKNRFYLLTVANNREPERKFIHWYETYAHSFIIHHTPEEIAPSFQPHLKLEKRSWIFTSATLSMNGYFDHYIELMGLEEAQTLQLDSPFDYANQALLYVPRYMPEPSAPDYIEAVVRAALPLLLASQGRAFLLFTSHSALRLAGELLKEKTDFPLLIQGTMSKEKLLSEFCTLANPVLLGTSSFWEGVDVRGDKLSFVMIDKLPFAVPGDPVFEARINLLKQQGKEPFQAYQLPEAVITLKQGAGRLIRDGKDRGVLMIADPRLITRDFGAQFLGSLPPMQRTREQDKAVDFLKAIP